MQHAPLAGRGREVEQPAEQAGGDDQRVHRVEVAAGARDVDLAPEAGGADHELRGDGEDQRDRGGDADAGRDVGHGARHGDPPHPLERARARTSAPCRSPPGRRPAPRRSSGSAAARTTRTRPGRPCSAGPGRRSAPRAGSARPTGSGAGTRSARAAPGRPSGSSRSAAPAGPRARSRCRAPPPSPASVEPTADQNAPSPSWLDELRERRGGGRDVRLGDDPALTTSSQSTSSTATAASGASTRLRWPPPRSRRRASAASRSPCT